MNGKPVTDLQSLQRGNAICIHKKHGRDKALLGVVVSVNVSEDIICFYILEVIDDSINTFEPSIVALKNEICNSFSVVSFKYSVCNVFRICVLARVIWNHCGLQYFRGVDYVFIIEDLIDSPFLFDTILCNEALLWYGLWSRIGASLRI